MPDKAPSKATPGFGGLKESMQTPADNGATEATAPVSREVPVPAVVRAVAMLRLLSSSPIPLGVNQIARNLDIIPSTCLHILRALTAEGLVAVDSSTKRYRLGTSILTLAKAALRDSISNQAQPYLDAIVHQFRVTALAVSLSKPDDYVVIAKSDVAQSFNLNVDLGSRFPALVSATGRCVAAYSSLPPRVLKAQFERLRWHNAPTYVEWQKQVSTVREHGYAVDDGNYRNGVYIVSAPILGPNEEFRHAIISVCIKEGWTEANLRGLAAAVRASALELTEMLSVNTKT